MPRHDRLMGRSDDMFIFRAVNIYPGQVESVVCAAEGVSSEYQIVLERHNGKDFMTVKVERAPGAASDHDARLKAEIERQIKNQIMVSAEVAVVDYGSLPRSERKSKRVFDNRAECATA
jgi:phenylacetate-CoA ligase